MDIFDTPAYKNYKDLIKEKDEDVTIESHDYEGPLYAPHPDLIENNE